MHGEERARLTMTDPLRRPIDHSSGIFLSQGCHSCPIPSAVFGEEMGPVRRVVRPRLQFLHVYSLVRKRYILLYPTGRPHLGRAGPIDQSPARSIHDDSEGSHVCRYEPVHPHTASSNPVEPSLGRLKETAADCRLRDSNCVSQLVNFLYDRKGADASSGVVASIVDLVYCVELLDLEDSTWREACVSITTYVPHLYPNFRTTQHADA